MSSPDCKAALVEYTATQGSPTQARDWKRRQKRLNEAGEVVRLFEHPTSGFLEVVERGGSWMVSPISAGSSETMKSVSPPSLPWSPAEIRGARALVRHLIDLTEKRTRDGVEKVLASANYALYGHALPAVIGFYFPESYNNCDADPADVNQPSSGLSVAFVEKVTSDLDPELDVSSLVQGLFPVWLQDRADETCWDIDPDCTLSVSEAAQAFRALGFSYVKDDCVFKHALPKALKAHPAAPFPGGEGGASRSGLPLTAQQATSALIHDDAGLFLEWVAQGKYKSATRLETQILEACREGKQKVFAALLPLVTDVNGVAFVRSVLTAALQYPNGASVFLEPFLAHSSFEIKDAGSDVLRIASSTDRLDKGGLREKMVLHVEQSLEQRWGLPLLDTAWVSAMKGEPSLGTCEAFSRHFASRPEEGIQRLLEAQAFGGAVQAWALLNPEVEKLVVAGQPALAAVAARESDLQAIVRQELSGSLALFTKSADGEYHRQQSQEEREWLCVVTLMAFLGDAGRPLGRHAPRP